MIVDQSPKDDALNVAHELAGIQSQVDELRVELESAGVEKHRAHAAAAALPEADAEPESA
jgi:hypothetical protein